VSEQLGQVFFEEDFERGKIYFHLQSETTCALREHAGEGKPALLELTTS